MTFPIHMESHKIQWFQWLFPIWWENHNPFHGSKATNQFSIYVPYMFHIFSIYFPYIFHICSIYVPYMFRICSVYVPYMFRICSVYVPYMFIVNAKISKRSHVPYAMKKVRRCLLGPYGDGPCGEFRYGARGLLRPWWFNGISIWFSWCFFIGIQPSTTGILTYFNHQEWDFNRSLMEVYVILLGFNHQQ